MAGAKAMAEAKPALPILSWQDSFRVAVVFFCLDEAGPNNGVFVNGCG